MKILSSGGHNGTLYIVPESFGGDAYDENPIIQTGKGHMATGSSARFHHIKTNIFATEDHMGYEFDHGTYLESEISMRLLI